jgi:hypothetical protein
MMSQVIGGRSIVMGVPVRGRLMAELEPVMGFFTNVLALPSRAMPTRPGNLFFSASAGNWWRLCSTRTSPSSGWPWSRR